MHIMGRMRMGMTITATTAVSRTRVPQWSLAR